MKKIKKILAISLCCLMLTACAENAPAETTAETTVTTEAETQTETETSAEEDSSEVETETETTTEQSVESEETSESQEETETAETTAALTTQSETTTETTAETTVETTAQAEEEVVNVVISVAEYGDIHLELYPEIAPITVENFVSLANDGFYEGIIFHRVIEDFMIQGGDKTGTGAGSNGFTITGEFASNSIENDISHTRGTISMARKGNDKDSASSQFFIVHKDSTFLDGDYAAFGQVTSGMEVVDAIAAVDTDSSDRPTSDVVIESVTVLE